MGIEVNPDALRDLGQDIADLLGMLTQLQIHMIDCDRKFVGHSGLADSYDSFTERWAVGVAALMEDAGSMSEQLVQAADAYEQYDQGVGENLRGILDDLQNDGPR
ncbi:WXG100 family type VII secretion target [Amycolatopsis thermoflava]